MRKGTFYWGIWGKTGRRKRGSGGPNGELRSKCECRM